MSLYAVANNSGRWLAYDDDGNYYWEDFSATWSRRDSAERAKTTHGGHVVKLVEKPAPVVVSEAEAKILEGAKKDKHPCMYIAWKVQADDEERLMRAYVNGYTVAKEKKYVVYKNLGGKHNTDIQYAQAYRTSAHSEIFSWIITSWILNAEDTNGSSFQFTESEIEHYGLQDCEKEEVTDDEQ